MVVGEDNLAKGLQDLILKNHETYGLLYNKVTHNHIQHGLLAAYELGGSIETLQNLYTEEERDLELWGDRKGFRISTDEDIDAHLGELSYERDFVQYFAKAIEDSNGDWHSILQRYLFNRNPALVTALVGGFAHPLILLTDAVESQNSTLAMDALALACVDYSAMAKLLELPEPPAPAQSQSVFDVLEDLRHEKVLDGIVPKPGIEKASLVLNSKPTSSVLLSYLGKLNYQPDDMEAQMKHLAELAAHLLVCTHVPGKPAYDFYLNHNLTFLNCVRILAPLFPHDHRKTLLRIYWLLTILSYVTQQRPIINRALLEEVDITMTWVEVKGAALGGDEKRAVDAHFLKAVQILAAFKDVWPDMEEMFLKAANKFVMEFEAWTGFGRDEGLRTNTSVEI